MTNMGGGDRFGWLLRVALVETALWDWRAWRMGLARANACLLMKFRAFNHGRTLLAGQRAFDVDHVLLWGHP
jgi:hypothetical protein